MKYAIFFLFSLLSIYCLYTTKPPSVAPQECGDDLSAQEQARKIASLDHPVLAREIKLDRGVNALAFSPNSEVLAIAADDYSVRLWNIEAGQTFRVLPHAIPGPTTLSVFPDGQRVYSLAYSPDGKIVASAGDLIQNKMLAGGQVTLWEASSGSKLRTILVNQKIATYTNSVSFTPDGKRFLVGMSRYGSSEEGEVSEWDVQTGSLQRKWNISQAGVHSVQTSPDGRSLAVGCSDGTLKIWDLATGKLRQSMPGSSSRMYSSTFSANGEIVAFCIGPDLPGVAGQMEPLLQVHMLNLKTRESRSFDAGHQTLFTAVAFSPDGNYLASGEEGLFSMRFSRHENGIIRIWRIR